MVPSGYCRLRNALSLTELQQVSGARRELSLLLFVLLEETGGPTVGEGSATASWGRKMDLMCELREVIEQLLQSQQRRFWQASHSALNKLLCNYGTHGKVLYY